MTIKKLFDMGVINDTTTVYVLKKDFSDFRAKGNWFQDDIQEYSKRQINSYSWRDCNEVYVDLK